ncbi:protein serine threonine [Stylonychia lemnae]|uniref:Protein serine threonine n=1 Tax=Stylonychia lemnae TaxID=5949 RepID=A0A078BCP1_STYLE|nr:protein serine threonine [Stylonychia lemnae]|eukprot:CDW91368.1 protein serine threonine [Stylonychia lemnae]
MTSNKMFLGHQVSLEESIKQNKNGVDDSKKYYDSNTPISENLQQLNSYHNRYSDIDTQGISSARNYKSSEGQLNPFQFTDETNKQHSQNLNTEDKRNQYDREEEQESYDGPRTFRFIKTGIGLILTSICYFTSLGNMIVQILYFLRVEYLNSNYYWMYFVFIFLRPIINLTIVLYQYFQPLIRSSIVSKQDLETTKSRALFYLSQFLIMRNIQIFGMALGAANFLLLCSEILTKGLKICIMVRYNKWPLVQKSEKEIIRPIFFKLMALSVISVLMFIVSFAFIQQVVPLRKCIPGQGFKSGQCVDCLDYKCSYCENQYNKCQVCHSGYYLDSADQCQKCTIDGCQQCDGENSCGLCYPGYRLEEQKCIPCDMMQFCGECNQNQCLTCITGYYMDSLGPQCLPCNQNDKYCEACDSVDKCTKCQPQMTRLTDGKCECNKERNWVLSIDQESCICDQYVTAGKNMCYTCDQIIPGCKSCSGFSDYEQGNIFIGSTVYSPLQFDYLSCEECLPGKYYNKKHSHCEQCSQITSQCSECDIYGQECYRCSEGFYLDKSNITQNRGICLSCGEGCQNCIEGNKCQQCKQGYYLNQSGRFCVKF